MEVGAHQNVISPSPFSLPRSDNIDKLQIMSFYVVSLLHREMSGCDICKNKECLQYADGVLSPRNSSLGSDFSD